MSKQAHASRTVMRLLDTVAIYGPLALSIWCFDSLVSDPVLTLSKLLPSVLLFTILPRLFDSRCSVASVLHSLGTLVALFLPATYVMVVLMGAPFTTHFPQTALFSTHLAVMLFFNAITKFGLDRQKWLPLVPRIETGPEDRPAGTKDTEWQAEVGGTGMEGIVWGTLAGAYLGAVPIPLDWDRAWQKWPVTVHIGACLGLAIGGTVQLLYSIFFRRSNRPRKVSVQNKKVQ